MEQQISVSKEAWIKRSRCGKTTLVTDVEAV
jgi:hypothetical protein